MSWVQVQAIFSMRCLLNIALSHVESMFSKYRISVPLLNIACEHLEAMYRAAACDDTGGVASLNFDATELQIF